MSLRSCLCVRPFVWACVRVINKYNNDSEDTSVKVQCEWLDKYLTTTG